MLLLLLLFDAPVQLLFLSPVLFWLTAAAHWRPLILVLGAISWGCFATILWRRFVRAEAEERTLARPEGGWRWPASMPAYVYEQNLRLLLHNHGWTGLQTLAIGAQAVTLRMQKDRSTVLLHCQRGSAPSEAELAALAALRAEQQASVACLVRAEKSPPALVADASRHGIHLLRLSDIPGLGNEAGPMGLAFG